MGSFDSIRFLVIDENLFYPQMYADEEFEPFAYGCGSGIKENLQAHKGYIFTLSASWRPCVKNEIVAIVLG